MRYRSFKTRAATFTATAVLAAASAAQAGFELDLRLAAGADATVSPGEVVPLEVWAQVTGAGTAAEGLQLVFFGINNSGNIGDLTTVALQGAYLGVATDVTPNVTTSNPGTLYGPAGSVDVGSATSDDSSASGWVFARATSMQTVTGDVKIGTLNFNVSGSATNGQTTTLSIDPRTAPNNLVVPALWIEDGVVKDLPATAGSTVVLTVQATTLVGDTNNDGVVDLTDLNNVLNNFGAVGAGNPGDDNNDGVVDLTDLNNVLNNFGATGAVAALSVVPEPATLSLVALGALGLIRRRSRR